MNIQISGLEQSVDFISNFFLNIQPEEININNVHRFLIKMMFRQLFAPIELFFLKKIGYGASLTLFS